MGSDEYVQKKYLLAYLQGRIDEEEYTERFGPLPPLPDYDYGLMETETDLELELKSYERGAVVPGPMMTYSEYVQRKLLLAYLLGRISEEKYLERYGFLPIEEIDVEDLQDELSQYEKIINRLDLNEKLPRDLREAIQSITQKFAYQVARGKFSTQQYETGLTYCPTLQECESHSTENCSVYFYNRLDLR